MKIFLYKLFISLVAFYIFFEITIGSKIDHVEKTLNSFKDDNQRILMKDKLKEELRKAIKKERKNVANMNFTCAGGSSRVFNNALNALLDSMCTSSIM